MAAENAFGIDFAEELVGGQQGVELAFAEPQARQFVPIATAVLAFPAQGVAPQEAVVFDGGTEAVAQVGQVALERGPGDLQLIHHVLEADVSAQADQALDAVEAFGVAHVWPIRSVCCPTLASKTWGWLTL